MSRAAKHRDREDERSSDRPTAPQTVLLVHVQPRASQTEVVGWHGDHIKIRLKSPPVDGAANLELVRFLAEQLRVARSSVRLKAGAAGRKKRVAIQGMTRASALERLGLTHP